MQPQQPINQLFRRLWHHVSARRRWQFGFLLALSLLVSGTEVLSIGAALPFLAALTAPARVFEHAAAKPFIDALGIGSAEQLLLPLAIAFGISALVAGVMRMSFVWAANRLSYSIGADLSISIYRRTLYQPYAVHVNRNSVEVINGILTKVGGITGSIMMLISIIGACAILVTVLLAMLYVDFAIAMAAVGGFGLIYGLIIWFTRKRLLRNSRQVARESTQVLKTLQEGLGGIRDVLVDGSQDAYCQIYRNAELPLRRAQASSAFISASPRYAVETLGMILIAALGYILVQQSDGMARVIPVLGALALGAQRLLPALQQAYAGWTNIRSSQASLQDALDLLDQPLPAYANFPAQAPLPFRHCISLDNISFRYNAGTPWVLENTSLTIAKGSRTGIVGTTGSGKSTLLDIIMGLLQPTEGTMSIDGEVITPENHRAWQCHVAHVPQAIFLADSTVAENIAFGQPKDQIDQARVRRSAQQAQIADAIETWPLRYETVVGERGVRLSGGQRQRIGIARALYKQAGVIIFDEATSALDTDTEQSVMEAIECLSADLTILIVAHRISTLRNCTQIVEVGTGGIRRTGTYAELLEDGDKTAQAVLN